MPTCIKPLAFLLLFLNSCILDLIGNVERKSIKKSYKIAKKEKYQAIAISNADQILEYCHRLNKTLIKVEEADPNRWRNGGYIYYPKVAIDTILGHDTSHLNFIENIQFQKNLDSPSEYQIRMLLKVQDNNLIEDIYHKIHFNLIEVTELQKESSRRPISKAMMLNDKLQYVIEVRPYTF